MKHGWLTKAGPYKVEHVACPRPSRPVDLKHPPLGLLHTTQGPTIEGALSVFRTHYAPHFTVGGDSKKRGRILQHVPLGEMAAALMNAAGGVETNREVRVQIEIVGFCAAKAWLPKEPTLSMLIALLAELRDAADIPLNHPTVARNHEKWMHATGWVGHADAPENDHTDPGHLDYAALLARARTVADVGRAKAKKKPRKTLPLSKTKAVQKAAKRAVPHPLCPAVKVSAADMNAHVRDNAGSLAKKPKAAPRTPKRHYYTEKKQVKLKKGERIAFQPGKGYYAKPAKGSSAARSGKRRSP